MAGNSRPIPGVDRSEISAGKRTPVAVKSAFHGHSGVRRSHFHLSATFVSHVSGLTPGLVGLVFGVIAFAASRARHETSGTQEHYRYPPMVGWLMAICGVFFLCIPLLPGRGDVPPLVFFAFFAAFAACAFAAAVYFFRFRVVVDETGFKFGTLRFETIPFAEVVDTDVTAGPRCICWSTCATAGVCSFLTCLEISRSWRIPWELGRRGASRELAPVFKAQ